MTDADEIRPLPPGLPFGPLEWVAETTSTNADLLRRVGGGTGTVRVADHQTAGRGRLGRRWESAAGTALLVSVLLRPRLALDRLHLVTLATGLAVVAACADRGVTVGLKWPNDVVLAGPAGDRKLAGVLAETALTPAGGVERVVTGVGLNLTADAYPPELAGSAVSLEELGEVIDDRHDLLVAVLGHLADRLAAAERSPGEVLGEARTRSATLGRRVRVAVGDEVVEGLASRLTDEGHLVLQTGGAERTIVAGDVDTLRPRTPPP